MRWRASWMSAALGARSVSFNFEHPNHDLSNGSQGIQLATLHLVEQAPQLRVVGHGLLEMDLRAARGDGEHLAGEVLPAALVEEAARLEVLPVRGDLVPQLRNPLAGDRLGEHDRRLPVALGVERENRAHL